MSWAFDPELTTYNELDKIDEPFREQSIAVKIGQDEGRGIIVGMQPQ